MARDEWMEQRLQNWARWKLMAGSGVLGYAAVNLAQADAGRDGYVEARVPINEVDASETDRAVQQLHPPVLRLTVVAYYTRRGGMKDVTRQLACAEATVHARISQAHSQLATYLGEARRRADAERQRVELLQQRIRPGTFTQ